MLCSYYVHVTVYQTDVQLIKTHVQVHVHVHVYLLGYTMDYLKLIRATVWGDTMYMHMYIKRIVIELMEYLNKWYCIETHVHVHVHVHVYLLGYTMDYLKLIRATVWGDTMYMHMYIKRIVIELMEYLKKGHCIRTHYALYCTCT